MAGKSNYGNGMYKQLMDIMGRLETVEKESTQKINTLNQRIDTLEKKKPYFKKGKSAVKRG